MLRKGDSAVPYCLPTASQRKSGGQLPPFMKRKDKIIISFKGDGYLPGPGPDGR